MTFRQLIPARAPEDIAFGIARVRLGGAEYPLPALPWEASDAWLASIDGRLMGLVGALDEAGNDYSAILASLASEPEALLDALVAYDTSHVLPDRDDLKRAASKNEILLALFEVWRAANPLLDAALEAFLRDLTRGLSSVLSSTPPEPTAGPPPTSDDERPRNGSTPSSTSPTTGRTSGSSSRSKRPASGGSSPTTRSSTGDGATRPPRNISDRPSRATRSKRLS